MDFKELEDVSNSFLLERKDYLEKELMYFYAAEADCWYKEAAARAACGAELSEVVKEIKKRNINNVI